MVLPSRLLRLYRLKSYEYLLVKYTQEKNLGSNKGPLNNNVLRKLRLKGHYMYLKIFFSNIKIRENLVVEKNQLRFLVAWKQNKFKTFFLKEIIIL